MHEFLNEINVDVHLQKRIPGARNAMLRKDVEIGDKVFI